MRRFLHTLKVKPIPIPREAKTVDKIAKHINGKFSLEPMPHHAQIGWAMPETVEASQLQQDEGVWYFIERSRAGNLPVYTDYNNAGGVWTEIRKIQGSAGALRNDLKKALDLPKKNIWVQGTSQRVIIKGNFSQQVKAILGETF